MHTKDKKNPDMLLMGYFMPLASWLNHAQWQIIETIGARVSHKSEGWLMVLGGCGK
jgi:hypothetical protein